MATSITDDVLKALIDTTEEIDKLDDMYDEKLAAERFPFRMELQKVFDERQPHLDKIDGFWGQALLSDDSNLKPLMNTTTDPKILRAITSLQIIASQQGNKLHRRVIVKLRQNMFIESTELFREITSDAETVAASGVKWKAGTDRARQDSVFRFFDSATTDMEFVLEALDSFDEVYETPTATEKVDDEK